MTEEQLLKMGPAHILSAITYLNLHGNGLSKMKGIQSLTSLKKLIVSFNELTTLEDISQMVRRQGRDLNSASSAVYIMYSI